MIKRFRMKRNKLNEALARKQILKNKKTIPSGNVQGWRFNDTVELTDMGFKDKNRTPRLKEYNALDKMR